jgi:hypothetical protein
MIEEVILRDAAAIRIRSLSIGHNHHNLPAKMLLVEAERFTAIAAVVELSA